MSSARAATPAGNTTIRPALLDYGFRLFFLGAAIWAIVDMSAWALFYAFQRTGITPHAFPSPMGWHAHEMVFGYGMAIVAGFLLTAVMNWTGGITARGVPLALIFMAWLLARVIPFAGSVTAFIVARCFDLAFLLSLTAVTVRPCLRRGQRANVTLILGHLGIMITASVLYALGTLGIVAGADRIGLYLGLYVLVLLTLVMGRRVIPFFIEGAAGGRLSLRNFRWVDRLIVPLAVVYAACEVIPAFQPATPAVALSAALVLIVRLAGWYTSFIWRRPLLWVLYLANIWFLTGFALRAASWRLPINPLLALHAFTAGGIGTITLGMMARVALGHSGRNVQQPPAAVTPMFILLTISVALRVFVPLLWPARYMTSVIASQFFWIAAFLLFVVVYAPILTSQVVSTRGRPL